MTLRTSWHSRKIHGLNASRKESRSYGLEYGRLDDKEEMVKKEGQLFHFLAEIHELYHENLDERAPVSTFVFCGMKSSRKGAVVSRLMDPRLGRAFQSFQPRCPLDITCIRDTSVREPVCELYGYQLELGSIGDNLTVEEAILRIVEVNRGLATKDQYSFEPLQLIFRSHNTQHVRFLDTPASEASPSPEFQRGMKRILSSEMRNPFTRLCVVLEPKEFDANEIISVCAHSLGDPTEWVPCATFVLAHNDRFQHGFQSPEAIESLFRSLDDNHCYPHVVSTFDTWPFYFFDSHQFQYPMQHFLPPFNSSYVRDGGLEREISVAGMGFHMLRVEMYESMLRDVASWMPGILPLLRAEISKSLNDETASSGKQDTADPKKLLSSLHKQSLLVLRIRLLMKNVF